MNHDEASLLIPDLAANRLDGDRAAGVERHVAECADCRDALALHRAFRREIASAGAPLFTPHPESSLLVDFAVAPRALETARLAEVESHVRVCPTCRAEAASIRRAEAHARSPWPGLLDALSGRGLPRLVPALVPTLLVLFLAYPAYLGVVRLPEMRREREQAVREAAALRDRPQPVPRSWNGGPVASLTLPAPDRGSATPAAPLPTVTLRPGQALQPVRIEFDPKPGPADRVVTVTLRGPDGAEIWRLDAHPAELWDAADEAINILLPVERAGAGAYVVDIRDSAAATPAYTGKFRIER